MQSTPVCKLQGREDETEREGGGLLAEEEDTEEEGSDEGRDREVRPQTAEEVKQAGEFRDLGESSGGGGLVVGVDKVMPRP